MNLALTVPAATYLLYIAISAALTVWVGWTLSRSGRQFLVDVFQMEFLAALKNSDDATLAAIAGKAIKESTYHLRRSTDWMLRLGDGTAESHRRLQHAVDELWGFTPELFLMDELDIDEQWRTSPAQP